MKPEVAIKVLVNATYSDEWQGNEDVTTAQHMAVDALKKQIPKKPNFVQSTPGLMSSFWWECPICTNSVVGKDYFCSYCGQALDWEETE